MSQVMVRSAAIRAACRRVRNASDLRIEWASVSRLLHDALDSDLDHALLARFAERAHLLADAIVIREPLIAGPALALDLAIRVMDDVLLARREEARRYEVMEVLFLLDELDDDEVAS